MKKVSLIAMMWLLGCTPSSLNTYEEVDNQVAAGRYENVCVGLKSIATGVPEYSAKRLVKVKGLPEVTECLCNAAYDSEKGVAKVEIIKTFAESERGDLGTCVLPALSDDRVKDRPAVAEALGRILDESTWEGLADVASSEAPEDVRAAAAKALKGTKGSLPKAVELATKDPSPLVRAAAMSAIVGSQDKDTRRAVRSAMMIDPSADVRLAAVEGIGKVSNGSTSSKMCTLMMEDKSAAVRAAAVKTFKGTTDTANWNCIRDRMLTRDDSVEVRAALLEVLQTSGDEDAAKILCESIGPWARFYITENYIQMDAYDIIYYQNDRDYKNSDACVARAMAQSGYSCYARHYLASWKQQLGGRARVPRCPGM